MGPDEMRPLVASAPIARLATVGRSGAPHLVPFVFALDGNTIYSEVDAKAKTDRTLQRIHNIEADPRVCVLVDHYEDDWRALWWVRLDGHARTFAPETDEAAHGRALLGAKYPQYEGAPPIGIVIAIGVERWIGWRNP